MGKMKELFMKMQEEIDLEREYLFNDILAQEQSYEEFRRLKKDPEMNTNNINAKIEVGNGKTTIQIGEENGVHDKSSQGIAT